MLRNLILVLTFLLIPPTILAAGNKYGVFVGVGNYPRAVDKLSSSSNDATEICRAFSADCGNGNTELLTDERATRAKIISSILNFQKCAGKGDLFVFYYSGHGTLFPDKFSGELDEKVALKAVRKGTQLQISPLGELFDSALIPFDSTKTDSEERAWRNLILDDELYNLFSEFTKNGVRVVFISDSCYSGGQSKGLLDLSARKQNGLGKAKFLDWKDAIGIKSESELKKGVLNQKASGPQTAFNDNYIMISSSAVNESSFSQSPNSEMQMSAFTYYFLEILNEHKSAGKPFTFETIKYEVSPLVIKYAERYKESQTPNVDAKYFKGSLGISVF